MSSAVEARWCGIVSLSLVIALNAFAVSSSFGATSLPEGRAYERVSPGFKNGYPVFTSETTDASRDGEAFFYSSIGGFAGAGEDFALNPYLARRTTSGWVTESLFPPPIEGEFLGGLEEKSSDLSEFEYLGRPAFTAIEDAEASSATIWRRNAGGSYERASPMMTTAGHVGFSATVVGAAADLSRFILSHDDPPQKHILAASGDQTENREQLFEVDDSAIRLLAVNEAGQQLTRFCDVYLGGPTGGVGAVSQPSASDVFFSVPLNTTVTEGGGCKDNPANPVQLLVRVDGSYTVPVSVPLPTECTTGHPCLSAVPKEAMFQGASEDGSRVYFTTTQPLVNGDEDERNDLYLATIGTNGSGEPAVTSLTQVSKTSTPGESAEVEGPRVVAVSPDGSHVYFVARGVLSTQPNAEGESAAKGAENLYVYDQPSGGTSFVADLCSGAGASGSATDARCPNSLGPTANDGGLWGPDNQQAQTTEDGRFLVFSTYARLIADGPEADTDSARDVYRYDSATGALRRVSLGEDGADGNGNNSLFDAGIAPQRFNGTVQEQYELGRRAISEDGSTIVLTSSEPLSNDADNGQQNVYVWHEGRSSLISSGTAIDADMEPVITPSGRDLFFTTSAGLIPSDTDGLRDVYDARINGGFPVPPVQPEECAGSEDGCRGPLTTPAAVLIPGSTIQPAGENFPETTSKPTVKKKPKAKKKARTRRRRRAKGAKSHDAGRGSRVRSEKGGLKPRGTGK